MISSLWEMVVVRMKVFYTKVVTAGFLFWKKLLKVNSISHLKHLRAVFFVPINFLSVFRSKTVKLRQHCDHVLCMMYKDYFFPLKSLYRRRWGTDLQAQSSRRKGTLDESIFGRDISKAYSQIVLSLNMNTNQVCPP